MEFTIDELTALVLEHGRRAIQARKTAAELTALAAEDDRLAQVYLEAGKRVNREKEERESKMNIRRIISGVSVLVLLLMVFSFGLSSQARTLAQDAQGTAIATAISTIQATVNGQPVDATLVPTVVATQQPTDSTDSVKIPMPVLVIVGLFAMIALCGVLLLISQVIKALEKMYPQGTVTTMSKALADGLEQILRQLNLNAPKTDTPADDFLLAITDPLTKAIIAKLREQGVVIPSTPPTDLTPQA